MANDFPEGIINQVAHRPWSVPDSPWLMTQSWHNLLFAHWPVDAALLRSRMPPGLPLHQTRRVDYSSRRIGDGAAAELVARYEPVGPPFHAEPGTLDHFLTERYCLYNLNARFRAYRLEIHHPPWTLHRAETTFAVNTMTEAAGVPLPAIAPILHFSPRQDAVAWGPETLETVRPS